MVKKTDKQPLPEGQHLFEVIKTKLDKGTTGKLLRVKVEVAEGKHKGHTLSMLFRYSEPDFEFYHLDQLLLACGVPHGLEVLDDASLEGKQFIGKVVQFESDGETRNKIIEYAKVVHDQDAPSVGSSLFDEFNADIKKLGVVGEDIFSILALLVLVSSYTMKPLHLLVRGESSSGKNYVLDFVLSLFPKHKVIVLSYLSPKALYHMSKSFRHKILFAMEQDGVSGAEYPIRISKSEGRLTAFIAEKGPGGIKTKEVNIEGPICHIATTVLEEGEFQDEARTIVIHPDESKEQTKRILKLQNKIAEVGLSSHPEQERIVTKWRTFFEEMSWHMPRRVRIPFAPLIEFKKDKIRTRRDNPKLLGLIAASAFLNQKSRIIEKRADDELIVAELEDYEVARRVLSPTLLEYYALRSASFVEELKEFKKSTGKDIFTIADMDKRSALSASTIRRR
ncbi:MAG: DUF669 domain-containing protein, partial [Actinobacteria bacterium]|nr:DUF669 domain-containing protein [Actinomycetota bacterium]